MNQVLRNPIVRAISQILKHLAGQHDQQRHSGVKSSSWVPKGAANLNPNDIGFLRFLAEHPSYSAKDATGERYISASGYDRNMRHLKQRLGARTKNAALFLGVALGYVDEKILPESDFESRLSPEEKSLVEMLAGGLTYPEIAEAVGRKSGNPISVWQSIDNLLNRRGLLSPEELVLQTIKSGELDKKDVLKRFYPDHYDVLFPDVEE